MVTPVTQLQGTTTFVINLLNYIYYVIYVLDSYIHYCILNSVKNCY